MKQIKNTVLYSIKFKINKIKKSLINTKNFQKTLNFKMLIKMKNMLQNTI